MKWVDSLKYNCGQMAFRCELHSIYTLLRWVLREDISGLLLWYLTGHDFSTQPLSEIPATEGIATTFGTCIIFPDCKAKEETKKY